MLVALTAACGGESASDDSVVVGEGEIPATFPADFPIPAGTVVGATVVDRVLHRSEASLQVPGGLVAAMQFFTVSLVGSGYVIDRSAGAADGWSIDFSREELRGSIRASVGDGGSVVVVSLNRA